MTTDVNPSSPDSPRAEAVQNVVDRVAAYQASAEDGVVEARLREALAEADIALDDQEVSALAQAIESSDGDVDVTGVLGSDPELSREE